MLLELFYQGPQTERGLDPARRRSKCLCLSAVRLGRALPLASEWGPAIPLVSHGRGYARLAVAFHRPDGSCRLRDWNGARCKFAAQGIACAIQSPAIGWICDLAGNLDRCCDFS